MIINKIILSGFIVSTMVTAVDDCDHVYIKIKTKDSSGGKDIELDILFAQKESKSFRFQVDQHIYVEGSITLSDTNHLFVEPRSIHQMGLNLIKDFVKTPLSINNFSTLKQNVGA